MRPMKERKPSDSDLPSLVCTSLEAASSSSRLLCKRFLRPAPMLRWNQYSSAALNMAEI